MTTPHHPPNDTRPSKHIVILLILLLLVATGIWILNSVNMLQGFWATVLSPIFTCVGTIIALMQWHAQVSPDGSAQITPRLPHEQFLESPMRKRKGAVIIYTNRQWRGTMLYLLAGLQKHDAPIEAIANVIVRQYTSHRLFFCHFPLVPPGHYTLVAPSKQRIAQITVYAGHVSEVDWR